MIKAIFSILLFLISCPSWSCTLEIPENILVVENGQQVAPEISFKQSECTALDLNSLWEKIKLSKGTILAKSLESSQYKIQSKSEKINIIRLSDELRKYLSQDSRKKLDTSLKSGLYSLLDNNSLKVECFNCQSENDTYQYNVNFIDHFRELHKISAQLKKVYVFQVYRATHDIPVFTENLSSSDFELVEIETQKPQTYFTDIELISFYKSNRTIKRGESILPSFLSSKRVINSGQIVKISIDSRNFNLTTTAKALEAGKINDNIKLQNLKTNKIFSAQVIGFGEAKVRL
ncbi:MAG: flagellar basal body P-ring formation protein FlgA [Halobacteriovoraceae bacterium]|nr:flagellar basal body P-ring formation protein FlgA [Halobacteriovoraceae bacterium]